MDNIQQSSSTQPSKFHQAWEGVKAVADAVFSCPVGWAAVTGTAVLVGAVTAAAGFGGMLGAGVAACLFFSVAMMAVIFPSGVESLVAFLTFGAIGGVTLLLGLAPAVSVVLTIILAGVAVTGIAGLLGCGLAHYLKILPVEGEHPECQANLSPKAQRFYQKTKENPDYPQELSRDLLARNDVKKWNEFGYCLLSTSSRSMPHYPIFQVKTLDVSPRKTPLDEVDCQVDYFFERFVESLFPKVKTIRCDEKWLRWNINLIFRRGAYSFDKIIVDGRTYKGNELLQLLKQYREEGQVMALSKEGQKFYRKLEKNPELIKNFNLKLLIDNNIKDYREAILLMDAFRKNIETFDADFDSEQLGTKGLKIEKIASQLIEFNLPQLKHLRSKNGQLENVHDLSECKALETVELYGCRKIHGPSVVVGLKKLKHLKKITIKDCGFTLTEEDRAQIIRNNPGCKITIE